MTPSVTSTENGSGSSKSSVPAPRFLPPGISVENFQAFASGLQQAVGKENLQIITQDTPLDDGDYLTIDCQTHDMHHLYDREEFVGSALIHPKNVADIQAIIKLCNEFLVPVWTYSKGHNIGYGGAAREYWEVWS
ncbi:FAD binding domain-containing protein [Colletotrichum tofieldiae]|nr:FAD binding domain-containing protein [Colletotrichum tofieldiae]